MVECKADQRMHVMHRMKQLRDTILVVCRVSYQLRPAEKRSRKQM